MIDLKTFEVWFVAGSQHIYGEAALKQVADNSQQIAQALARSREIPVSVVFKTVVKTPAEATRMSQEANNAGSCGDGGRQSHGHEAVRVLRGRLRRGRPGEARKRCALQRGGVPGGRIRSERPACGETAQNGGDEMVASGSGADRVGVALIFG